MQSPTRGRRAASSDQDQQLLAMVEAEVGSLLELLPVPLLVTSATGDVLRANTAAGVLLEATDTLVGRNIEDVLRQQAVSVRVRTLSHGSEVRRLYALDAETLRTLLVPSRCPS